MQAKIISPDLSVTHGAKKNPPCDCYVHIGMAYWRPAKLANKPFYFMPAAVHRKCHIPHAQVRSRGQITSH